jgi:hypothetical protein
MWAEVGKNLPALGPTAVVVIALAVPVIAVLGTIVLMQMASKSSKPEGEIRVRTLGIVVRWGQSQSSKSKRPSHPTRKEVQRPDTKVSSSSKDATE